MNKGRYSAWAGIGHSSYLDVMEAIFGRRTEDFKKMKKEMRFETIWPIIDNHNCGDIDGFPRPDQMCAFTFEATTQAALVKALNREEQFKEAIQDFMGMVATDRLEVILRELKRQREEDEFKDARLGEAKPELIAKKKRGKAS